MVYALNVNSTALRTLLAELDDMTWTSVGASTTTRTLLFINLRNASFRIDRDCAKLAGSHAIATTQTAETAAGEYTAIQLQQQDTRSGQLLAQDGLATDGYYTMCMDGKWA